MAGKVTMGSEIPQHHIRKEVCTTRPSYRQGRHLKAVKVYTINQESRHIIIHGLPLVGGGSELRKMCQQFGDLEEFRTLDGYPSDEFTEVYWVKYQKIQSARHAKRRLDDISLLGGVLHVFYAPEYESVPETRDKLQERRKVVAAQLRKLAKERDPRTNTLKSVSSAGSLVIQSESKSLVDDTLVSQGTIQLNESTEISQNMTAVNHKFLTGSSSAFTSPSPTPVHHIPNSSHPNYDGHSYTLSPLLPPPPPPPQPHCGLLSVPVRTEVVRSSRPLNIGDATRMWNMTYEYKPILTADDRAVESSSEKEESEMSAPAIKSKPKTIREPKPSKDDKMNAKVEKLVLRDYKVHKSSAPRFVPRQVVHDSDKIELSDVDIRSKAVQLRDVQGPAVPDAFRKPGKSQADVSLQKSISEIRNKMKKICDESAMSNIDSLNKRAKLTDSTD